MKTPDRTTAAAFQRYLSGEVLADSAALQLRNFWRGNMARRPLPGRIWGRLS